MIKIKYFISEEETTVLQKLADAEANRINNKGGLAGHNVKIEIVDIDKLPNVTSESTIEIYHQAIKKYLEENELGMGKLLPAFRVCLTGLGMGPSLFDIASLLGKEETIRRMETALEKIN